MNLPLPGAIAHANAAPLGRMKVLEQFNRAIKTPQLAAVLILIYPKDNHSHFVCIKRNAYPGVHSAQISFPGGKCDTQDANLCATALRETYEEVGIPESKIKVLRPLSELYIPPSNFLVTPYLAMSETPITFSPNPAEVQRVLEIPIDMILNEKHWISQKIKTSYAVSIDVPGWQIDGEFIWGATAMMLSEVKACLNKVLESS